MGYVKSGFTIQDLLNLPINLDAQVGPTAGLNSAPDIQDFSNANYTFVVYAQSPAGLNFSSIENNNNAITVFNSSFTANAVYQSSTAISNGYLITYQITAPPSNGDYTIQLNANEFQDGGGTFNNLPITLGTFGVVRQGVPSNPITVSMGAVTGVHFDTNEIVIAVTYEAPAGGSVDLASVENSDAGTITSTLPLATVAGAVTDATQVGNNVTANHRFTRPNTTEWRPSTYTVTVPNGGVTGTNATPPAGGVIGNFQIEETREIQLTTNLGLDGKYSGVIRSTVDNCIYAVGKKSNDIIKIDPETGLLTHIANPIAGSDITTVKWKESVQIAGIIYWCPVSSGVILVYNVATGVFSSIDLNAGNNTSYVRGITVGQDGLLYMAPNRADALVRANPTTGLVEEFATTDTRNQKHGNPVTHGQYIVCAPYQGRYWLVFDTLTNTLFEEHAGINDNATKFHWVANGPDGLVYGSPRSSDNLQAIDPATRMLTNIPLTQHLGEIDKYQEVILSGNVLGFAQWRADSFMTYWPLEPNPANRLRYYASTQSTNSDFYTPFVRPNGEIVCVPRSAAVVQYWNPATEILTEFPMLEGDLQYEGGISVNNRDFLVSRDSNHVLVRWRE